MKFVVLVHATADSESGRMPTEAELAEMTVFNEALVEAGVMLGGEGLHPTSRGARIEYSGDAPTITDGPFSQDQKIVSGYWLLQADSLDAIKDWMRKAPFRDGSIEIRQIFGNDDFGEAFTPELQAREAAMRQRVGEQTA